MKEIIFLFVLFVANVIQAITGFAGTVLAMPPSMYLLGMDDAKVVLNVMALLSGLMIAVMSYHHMNKKELAKICVFMVVGMEISIQICKAVPSEKFLLVLYGIIIILIAGKNLLYHQEHTLPKGVLLVVLLLAGVIHGMFVSGGALLVVYATQVLKDKEEFRATIAPVWVVLNSILLASQVRQGAFDNYNIRLILISVIPLFIATWAGKKLVKKVSQRVFLNLTYVLLLVSGLSLIL
jgi:uncharacterized membrane protein YfcA